jgi:hypothetical protein
LFSRALLYRAALPLGIAAINTYAVPVLAYSFGIIKWTQTDIHALEILTRTTLTKHRMHHPKSAIERVTLPREKGVRGLTDLNNLLWKRYRWLVHIPGTTLVPLERPRR